MRILWFCLILHTVFAEHGFGSSYLGNTKLCQPWTCLNNKLGLPEDLPPKEQYTVVLKNILPEGPWQNIVNSVVRVCYDDRPRRYTNTCPGQALMHCVVEQLIQNCPEDAQRKDDACSPVSSLAGFKYMFSQSLYVNLEKNLPNDRRPSWFLKNYFNTKCCNFPEIFNTSIIKECGFSTIIHYYLHGLRPINNIRSFNNFETKQATKPKHVKGALNIVELSEFDATSPTSEYNEVKNLITDQVIDPLDCCDISEFIQPTWRSECGFGLQWNVADRLVIQNDRIHLTTTASPTTTLRPINDVKVVPQTCEKVDCVFKKLNIVSETGSVDVEAFSKFLDNLTNVHPEWNKAKARVVTKCLSKPVTAYQADCEINKVLGCVFDVLSENCPFAKKNDPCKHSSTLKDGITCQISSSKYRPKNRRQFCGIPSLVNHEVLSECDVTSISHMEHVKAPQLRSEPKKHTWSNHYKCKDLTESTTCIMNKMSILNKYKFMDYFKMKDRMRHFTTNYTAWSPLIDIYMSAFTETPMYQEHCNSPKKLLNVVDSMLMTCPVSRRKSTQECDKFFTDLKKTQPRQEPSKNDVVKEKVAQLLGHYHHIFLPNQLITKNEYKNIFEPKYTVEKKPIFNFGLFGENPPPVRTIDVQPKLEPRKPLVLLPVYARMPNSSVKINSALGNNYTINLSVRPNSGLFRRASFLLRNRLSTSNLTTPRTTFEFDNKL